jgi:hypothetical protein
MPVKIANSTRESYDFACLRHFQKYRGLRGQVDSWLVAWRNAISDEDVPTEDEQDLSALREAISSSSNTISYEQFRKSLGLR